MRIDILSLFPDYFKGPFDHSIVARAQQRGLIELNQIDIRTFATDRHRRVDDRPYGGGPGMVMLAEPIDEAIKSCRSELTHVIHLSPQGKPLTAEVARTLAQKSHVVMLCGHYEGIDQRVLDQHVDEEISIGDYVLTNGCLPAIVLVDALVRFVPGVLGHEDAASRDSFEEGIFDCPHYTRPEVWQGKEVPAVLRSGDHSQIAKWREQQALEKTKLVRPELVKAFMKSRAEKRG